MSQVKWIAIGNTQSRIYVQLSDGKELVMTESEARELTNTIRGVILAWEQRRKP